MLLAVLSIIWSLVKESQLFLCAIAQLFLCAIALFDIEKCPNDFTIQSAEYVFLVTN